MSRLFDFKCRTCGAEKTVTGRDGRDPGAIVCPGCGTVKLVSWRSRPKDPFKPPDTVAMGLGPSPTFGPSPEEIADTGIAYARVRYDHESMQMKEEAPVLNRDAKKQLRLI